MLAEALQRHLARRPLWAVGSMCGTSLDGVDVALLEMVEPHDPRSWRERGHHTHSFERLDVSRLRAVAQGKPTDASELSALASRVAHEHEMAVRALCERQEIDPTELAYVAAHGITLWHEPGGSEGHGWQLLSGGALAARLGTLVLCDFRSADLALGGQGAPLAPLCDLRLRADEREDRVILNLGGIANLTALPAGARTTGDLVAGDVGPANLLLDGLRRRQTAGREGMDRDGALASLGRCDPRLLRRLLKAPWVRSPLPRSFGREQFGDPWIDAYLDQAGGLPAADQMTTLVALEAEAVRIFLEELAGDWRRSDLPLAVYLTGGGRHNRALEAELRRRLPKARVAGIEELGVDPDAKEAIDFALLGWLALCAQPGGGPPVTGAQVDLVLGALHAPHLVP